MAAPPAARRPDLPGTTPSATALLDRTLTEGGLAVQWSGASGEPVVTVTLDRPGNRNAQTPATWHALAAVGDALPGATRVVVLRSTGPTFSSGLDLRMFSADGVPGETSLATVAGLPDAAADEVIAGYQRGFTWLSDLDVVSIAVVQGAAVGAGFQLALACDLRVCADDARFSMRETTLGLVPDLTGTHPLVREVGYSRALQICLTGRWIDAADALSLGLATTVVATGEQDQAAAELVSAVLAAPERAVRATSRLLREAYARPVAEQRHAERVAQLDLLRAHSAGPGIAPLV
ncbi:MAG TPA: enoyl-CoA hydratase/isomerase family protein [Candidatus Nanopelagicales bacterium]